MTTHVPTLVCERCPIDDDAWYGSDPIAFEEHLRDRHGIILCRKCGCVTGNRYAGWCYDCFLSKYAD